MALGGRVDREPVAGRLAGVDPDIGKLDRQASKYPGLKVYRILSYDRGSILAVHREASDETYLRHVGIDPNGGVVISDLPVGPIQGPSTPQELERES